MITGLAVILFFYFLGEFISFLLSGILPGSVCGMILLFCALIFKIVPAEAVKGVATTITKNMVLFYIPAGVGLMVSIGLLTQYWLYFSLVIIVATVVSIAVVGLIQSKIEKKSQN